MVDEWRHIRAEAQGLYLQHPAAMSATQYNMTMKKAEFIHSQIERNMTALAGHIRNRRKTFMEFLKALSFELGIPTSKLHLSPVLLLLFKFSSILLCGLFVENWVKSIGTAKLGAEFGIYLENNMKLDIDDLAGSFEVNVDDRAWVTALLGFIGIDFDVIRAEACFRGGIGYDLNILKDFGADSIVDVVKNFDKIFLNIKE